MKLLRTVLVFLLLGFLLFSASPLQQHGSSQRVAKAQSDFLFLQPGKFQEPGPQIDYTPQSPFDLTGPLPFDEEAAAAVEGGVEYLLKLQKENGSWDMPLRGELLSGTADQAVDAVASTALAGLALRKNVHVAPDRIEPALSKAADFIMDRIRRGKLSTQIYYAIWRYNLGLRFLNLEYMASRDEDRKKEIEYVCRKMIQSLLNMQLFKGEPPTLERKKPLKLDVANPLSAQPAKLGLTLKTGADGKGAVIDRVLENSPADKAGLKSGDVMLVVDDFKIRSPYEFYDVEVGLVSGQEITVLTERNGKASPHTLKPQTVWPGVIGLKLEVDENGACSVCGFEPNCPCRGAGFESKDLLKTVNGKAVRTPDDFAKIEAELKAGDELKFEVIRGNEKKSFAVNAQPLAPGSLDIELMEEDKQGLDGVVIFKTDEGGAAAKAGLKANDRILSINGTPVMGMDHFVLLQNTFWGGQEVDVTYIRKGETAKVSFPLTTSYKRGLLGVTFAPGQDLVIGTVKEESPAAKAGVKVGDKIVAINDKNMPNSQSVFSYFIKLRAGEVIKLKLSREGKDVELDVELAERSSKTVVHEEGGWNYYPMGNATSFVTASTLIALLDVERDMKIEIPDISLEAAVAVVESSRAPDPNNKKIEGYHYRAMPQGPEARSAADMRGHMGRITGCELSLVRATDAGVIKGQNARTQDTLNAAMRVWLDNRKELDKVRDFKHTHHPQLYNNAAYYWLFGHYYSAVAANYMKDKKLAGEAKEAIIKALLLKRLGDGTWLGHAAFGPICGTSEALMTFGELKEYCQPSFRMVEPVLFDCIGDITKRNYGKAWKDIETLQAQDMKNKKLANDAKYLFGEIEKRVDRHIEHAQNAWKRNPLNAIELGGKIPQTFPEIPKAQHFGKTLDEWKNSTALEAYKTLSGEFADLRKKIADAGTFLSKEDAAKYESALEDLAKRAGEYNLAAEAREEKDALINSMNGMGFLGINIDTAHEGPGLVITTITKNMAADKAGLREGDKVVKWNGEDVKGNADFMERMGKTKPGDKLEFIVERSGESITLGVTLGRRN